MSEETKIKSSAKEDFIEFLQSAIEKIQDVTGSESRRFNEIWGWQYPPIGKMDIVESLENAKQYLETHEFESLDEFAERLLECKGLIEKWLADPLSHFYDNRFAKDLVIAFDCIDRKLKGVLYSYSCGLITPKLQEEAKRASQRILALKKRLDRADGSVEAIDESIRRISEADETASRLPETLEMLNSYAKDTERIKKEIEASGEVISKAFGLAKEQEKYISDTKADIEGILKRSKAALASATSASLAGAFYDRKKELQFIGLAWTICLALALGAAVASIWWRSDQLFALLDKANEISTFTLVANFVISIGFIGAPIWFAWLATKQVGYYFRLSEDYAFKASVSASYEGFMEEARRHDAEFEKKVLESTLDRYDEPPLRFVDGRVHGSPYQELFESEEFKSLTRTFPDLKDHIMTAIKECLKSVKEGKKAVEDKATADSK